LNSKQQSIVTISALTATGDLPKLQKQLTAGLDAGLTINEIKEVIVQLYAYTGFPRSLNVLNTFIAVLKERKGKGFNDQPGKDPSPYPTNKSKLQFGTEIQTKLVGQAVKGAVFEFAPAIDQFLKEHLFGDIFGRDNLDWQTRELATIAALAALGNVDNQLRSHFGVGMYNGVTVTQLHQLVSIIQSNIGAKEGNAANQSLQTVLGAPDINNDKINSESEGVENAIFPKGSTITSNNFKGTAWLQNLVADDSVYTSAVGNVTFEPGARTNWHYHPRGQILLATNGVGYYQEKGSPKRFLRKGDVITCPPNVAHWHGASADTGFIQIAITDRQKGLTVWLDPVTDKEYNSEIRQ
jgi:4-carboxymuconolactone decarboxylase